MPTIVSSPANSTVVAGGDVTLSCSATGVPAPLIRWYDSRGLEISQELPPKAQSPPPAGTEPSCPSVPRVGWGSLHLQNLSSERAGEFRCEAINEHGSALSSAFLTVGELKHTLPSWLSGSGEKCPKIRNKCQVGGVESRGKEAEMSWLSSP